MSVAPNRAPGGGQPNYKTPLDNRPFFIETTGKSAKAVIVRDCFRVTAVVR